MRALHPMTNEEREFAEQRHGLVIDFLRCKRLPMNEFYDVVIFGYLSAVQKNFRDHNLDSAEYNGVRCMAIFNFFTGAYYVDDVYGVQEGTHA